MGDRRRISSVELVLGLGLVALGAIFMLGQVLQVNFWRYTWPLFVMLPGFVFMGLMLAGGKNMAPFAIPGTIISTVGLVLLYQTLSGHWESWAYIWALIAPTSVGVGLWLAGVRAENPSLREAGGIVAQIGFVIFVLGGLFFEVVLQLGADGVSSSFWPAVLILLGVYIIVRPMLRRKSDTAAPSEGAAPTIDVELSQATEAESPSHDEQ